MGFGAESGTWRVTAQDHVGSLVVDDVQLLIRPKIKPENLFYATNADLLPSVIAFFARTVETTLARGVLRSYREHDPASPSPAPAASTTTPPAWPRTGTSRPPCYER